MIVYGWGGAYNKRDWRTRWGHCDNCGHVGNLEGFSFTKYVTVYFVPIFPHGTGRMLDYCRECKQGRVLSVGEWRRKRDKLPAATRAFEKDPENRELAEKTLGELTVFGDESQFLPVALQVADRYSKDAEMMAQLGTAMCYFGRLDEGRGALRKSMELSPDEDTQKYLEFLDGQKVPAPPEPDNAVTRFAPLLIVPGIAVAVLLALVFAAMGSSPENVYVVNGLDTPYSVLVNGEAVEVPANGKKRVTVDYGTVTVAPAPNEGLPLPEIEVELSTTFFNRTSEKLLFVLNPDRTALLHLVRAQYSTSPRDGGDTSELRIGEGFYELDDIDYIFERPPETVSIPSRSSVVTKVAVVQSRAPSSVEFIDFLAKRSDAKTAAAFLAHRLRLAPQTAELLPLAVERLGKAQAFEIVRPLLAQRPVLVRLHRTYQQIVQSQGETKALLEEYERLLAAEPENNSLEYLVGRLIEDPARSQAMFAAATQGPNPEPFGYYGLCFGLTMRCEFDAALKAIDSALASKPDVQEFKDARFEALLPTKKWKELAAAARREQRDSPNDIGVAMRLVAALSADGDAEGAAKVKREYLARLKAMQNPTVPAKQIESLDAVLTTTTAQWSDQAEAVAASARRIGSPLWTFVAALAADDLPEAITLVDKQEETSDVARTGIAHLGLYAMAAAAGEADVASKQLTRARERLAKEGGDRLIIARWFADDATAPTLDETHRSTVSPDFRKVCMLALGTRFPKAKATFFRRAAELNFERDAWYFTVKRMTGTK